MTLDRVALELQKELKKAVPVERREQLLNVLDMVKRYQYEQM